jgi:hypothetical protein
MEIEGYFIKDVGNYQLCTKDTLNPFVAPMNAIQKDILIKSKTKTFLVLRHAILVDLDFINFVMNSKNKIDFNIVCNHIARHINEQEEFTLERVIDATLVNMRISCESIHINEYDLVFEVHSIKDK